MKYRGIVYFLFFHFYLINNSFAQNSIKDENSTIDVTQYHLNIEVVPSNHSIKGYNQIDFKAVTEVNNFVIHLDTNFVIDSVVGKNKSINYSYARENDQIKFKLKNSLSKGQNYSLKIYYHGIPRKAPHAPWEGGFVWSKDSLNNDWIGVTCEGEGASIWWPCKNDPADEPDSAKVSITCPSHLFCVSNGTLENIETRDSLKTYHWKIHYPINNYNITLNIGNYVHFSDTLKRKDGTTLPLDYYVLSYNLSKAQKHFTQLQTILPAFEKFFGPYPFPSDGYALVETSYWGMEHQSAIAYGNKYRNNMGPYDFIIVHETAHEWWGNSITAQKMSELWIHESFATYAECLLIEEELGKEKALAYLEKQKLRIQNQNPLLGKFTDMPQEDTDIYYKGTWMLHTLRGCVNNDEKWFNSIYKFSTSHKHKVVNTNDVIKFFSREFSKKLTPVFEHYLYKSNLPELHYFFKKEKNGDLILTYCWKRVDKNFKMPVWIEINQKKILLKASIKKRKYNLGEIQEDVVQFMTQLQLFEAVKDVDIK